MKHWDIILETPTGFVAAQYVGRNIRGETAQDALELWRLQHPEVWSSIDLKNRTMNGSPFMIVESDLDPNKPTPIILL